MKNWEQAEGYYDIIEMNKKKVEKYPVRMTGKEVSEFCKAKMYFNGYVEGVGGDRSYSCIAILRAYV